MSRRKFAECRNPIDKRYKKYIRYLKHFIQAKTITFTADEERPTPYLRRMLKRSEEDIKAGRVISFQTGQEALDYLDREIEDERRKKKHTR